MRLWVTEIKAIDPRDGELKTWAGPYVPGLTQKLAQEWCYKHKGYLKVIGEAVMEVETDEEWNPIWSTRKDFNRGFYN